MTNELAAQTSLPTTPVALQVVQGTATFTQQAGKISKPAVCGIATRDWQRTT
jgi:hypothetical protein